MLPFLFLGLYHARTKILHQTLLTNNSPSLWLDTGDHKTEWKKWIIGSNVTEIYNCDISISKGEKVFAKMKKKICFNVQFANGRCKINFLVELVHNANCIILYIFPLFFSFFSSFFFCIKGIDGAELLSIPVESSTLQEFKLQEDMWNYPRKWDEWRGGLLDTLVIQEKKMWITSEDDR